MKGKLTDILELNVGKLNTAPKLNWFDTDFIPLYTTIKRISAENKSYYNKKLENYEDDLEKYLEKIGLKRDKLVPSVPVEGSVLFYHQNSFANFKKRNFMLTRTDLENKMVRFKICLSDRGLKNEAFDIEFV